MDHDKKKKFNERMGKGKLLRRGGSAEVKHYDDGGSVQAGGVGGKVGGIFTAPEIANPVTAAELQNAQNQVNQGYGALMGVGQPLATTGAANLGQVYGQLQGVAAGTGPNPALAQLSSTTGQNVANTRALMAGQRGASSSVGLLARQAAQQGAATQQQAVGQGATLAAQQELNAIGQAGGIAGNQTNAGIGAIGQAGSLGEHNQAQMLGAAQNYNTQLAGAQSGLNSIAQNFLLPFATGAASGAGSALSAISEAHGGEIHRQHPNYCKGPHNSHVANFMYGGESDGVKAKVSPGEKYLSPDEVKRVVEQGHNPLKMGHTVPGKAKVKGDSLKNDTVPATLQEGGVVIPRHIMNKKDPEKAELFVRRAVHLKRAK